MDQIFRDISALLSESNRKFFSGKSVLITGASGLMGSYFAAFLQELNTNCDDEIKLFLSSKSGCFEIAIHPETEVFCGDISNSSVLSSLPQFDVIIHAAGYGQPMKFLEDTKSTITLNTTVTLDLFRRVNPGGCFLFLSTSEIYSGLSNPPFKEEQVGNTNTNHERAPYIESKRSGEAIVASMKRSGAVSRASSVRLALAYGPGTKKGDSRVLNSFIEQAITSGQINMKDSGLAWRTYCYVLDAIELCIDVLKSGRDDIYNVGGISRLQIVDLAKEIARITNARLVVPSETSQFLNGAPDDVWLNLERVLGLANKKDFISMSEGLNRTINWTLQGKSS